MSSREEKPCREWTDDIPDWCETDIQLLQWKVLEAFHMKCHAKFFIYAIVTAYCQRKSISAHLLIPPIMDLDHQTTSFVSIARLTQRLCNAHDGRHCPVALSPDRSFTWSQVGRDWRRRPGRLRARWTDQLRHDTGLVPVNLWRQAVLRGHGEATQRPELATP